MTKAQSPGNSGYVTGPRSEKTISATRKKADSPTATTRRSIILITIDSLRADHLGCYGYSKNTSKNIDRLAEKSTLFVNTVTPRTKTAPAITSILTGLYPHTHKVRTNWLPLKKEVPTVQAILRSHGYLTGAVLGNFVLKHKFSGLGRGFDTFEDRMPERELNRNIYEKTAEKTTEIALGWLQEHGQEPFFLWLHYQDPHGPYTAPERYQRASSDSKDLIPEEAIPEYQRLPGTTIKNGLVNANFYRDAYDAEIRYCDNFVGRLLDGLERIGLTEAVIILTADHGESLGEHDYYFEHGKFVYEPCTRVPLLINIPNQLGLKTIRQQVNLMDIAPTILEIAEVPVPSGIEGASLIPLIRGESPTGDEFIFIERENQIKAVRTDTWKYILNLYDGTEELYHLPNDPLETRNLISKYPGEVERLSLKLQKWMNINDTIDIDEKQYQKLKKVEQEALQSLGYL